MSALISVLASAASLIFNTASSGSAKSAASRRSGADVEPEPSAVVTLSPQAEAMAGFAGKGIMVSQGKLENALGAVARSSGGGAANAVADALSGRPVSTQDFQELLTRFGADDTQKAQLTAGFDANKDGAISQDEFLKGLAKTKGTQGTPADADFSQAVMQLMDRGGRGNADGTVAAKEFADFATAFATAGKRPGVA
jgi:Ca2+-binding EF-hand superfamily protein